MAVFLISYDLKKPARDYEGLWKHLNSLSAVWALTSVWLLDSQLSAVQLREAVQAHIDQRDLVFVAELKGAASWNGLLGTAASFLQGHGHRIGEP